MNTRFEVSYKTIDPKNGNAPSVSIIGKLIEEYKISYFIEGIENQFYKQLAGQIIQ